MSPVARMPELLFLGYINCFIYKSSIQILIYTLYNCMLYKNDNEPVYFFNNIQKKFRSSEKSIKKTHAINLSVTQNESSSSFCITQRKLDISVGN